MKKILHKMSNYVLLPIMFLLGALLSPLLVSRIAHAETPSVIYACVGTNGSLRIVESTTTCKSNETPLSWNQQGVQGPPGQGGGPILCPGCNFSYPAPSLVGKDFTGANLNSAQFSTDVSHANFTNAYLSGASFGGGHILDGTIFHNVTSDQLSINFAVGNGTDFSGIHGSSGATHIDVVSKTGNLAALTNANFQGAIATIHLYVDPGPTPPVPDFTGADFTGANLASQSDPSSFLEVNLTNANFTNADLRYTTDMGTATLTGVIWSNTWCPDGTNSSDPGNGGTCLGHL